MRKIITGGIAITAGLSTILATGAFAGGNGAQRSGLTVNGGSTTDACQPGNGTGGNGFVILNAPGNPAGPANKLIGEVSLKGGDPNTSYIVNVASNDGNDKCTPEGTLTTNGVGNGNAHIVDKTLGQGTFYVVLQKGSKESFASGPLTVK